MHNHLLFFGNVCAHLVASMSGLVSFIFAIVEHIRSKKIETWAFVVVGTLCLLVAFDQAWQDEHRNSEVLKSEKVAAASDRNFWKQESYTKDASLQQRDLMLGQNFSVLSQTQASLAALSSKVLDINKPEAQVFTIRRDDSDLSTFASWKHRVEFLIMTNKSAEAHFQLSCDTDIPELEAHILEGGMRFPNVVMQADKKTWLIRIPSPQVTPHNPLIINIGFNDDPGKCSIEPK